MTVAFTLRPGRITLTGYAVIAGLTRFKYRLHTDDEPLETAYSNIPQYD